MLLLNIYSFQKSRANSQLVSVPDVISFCMLFHVVTNHACKYLAAGLRQVIERYLLLLVKSSVFGNSNVRPCVSQSDSPSGCSNHLLKHFNIALHVPLNFFHQKFCTPSIPGADQFFRLLTVWCNFFSVIVNSCTFATFCLIFFATVFVHFRCGVLVWSSQIPAQNSSNFYIPGTFPFSCFVPCVFL